MEKTKSRKGFSWSLTEKVAFLLGFAFTIGFVAFFSQLCSPNSMNYVPIEYFYIVTAVYSVALLLWIWGIVKNKTEYMLTSLIAWGAPLNLWTGVTFFIIFEKIFYHSNTYAYHNRDILIVITTAMFVTFYFMVLTGYRAIHKNEAQTNASSDIRLYIKSGTFDWKVTAIAANWLIMGFCSGQTAFFLSRVFPETTETFLFAIFLIFALNVAATISFGIGIFKNKVGRMLASLIWWGMCLCLWIIFVTFIKDDGRLRNNQRRMNILYGLTAFCMIVYLVAVLSYTSIKRSIHTKRLDVVYSVASTANREFYI